MNENVARARVVVLYESMFGATRRIAEVIAEQLRPFADVVVVDAVAADLADVTRADLLVAGAPTHVFGLSSETTRHEARNIAERSKGDLVLEHTDPTRGLRELLRALPWAPRQAHVAAFSTRSMKTPRLFTGSAARRIDRDLRASGYQPLVPPRDFLVDATHRLIDGQPADAAEWGVHLASRLNLHRQGQLGRR
ncbi:flavodoxin domain-containing protein [Herbiconiux sp. A18JL235]|uniref:Flavodoxin domain-containing protein n=1 Tax=Herbiconiux sp. A18JL235 TaxID=3152363 RepID=A0AB39BC08_9MICO